MRGSVGGRPPSSADLVFLKHKATGAVARLALVGVPAAFLGLFFFYPLATILRRGLGGSLPTDVLLDRGTLHIVWFTVWQATASTVLTLVAGMPLAWATASRGPQRPG